MSTPHTPSAGDFRAILQLSKPFLSASEIKYCYAVQGISSSDKNQTYYQASKVEILGFLKKVIRELKFPTNILQLTLYYYQRLYLFNSFDIYKNAKYDIAVAALYISSKVQDYIKKLRDIVKAVNDLQVPGYITNEMKILQAEKKFLATINFDFRYQSSEDLVMRITNSLNLDHELRYTSWLINNDTYITELHLKYPVNVVALACIKTAAYLHNVKELPVDTRALKIFKDNFVTESIEEILKYYMDNYNGSFLSSRYGSDKKQEIMDMFITLKIDVNQQLEEYRPSKKRLLYNYEDDEFFKNDRDFNKNDNVRFVYQKANYIDEL